VTAFTGTIPTIASGDTTTVPASLATYRDALKAATEAWTSYTPAWSSTGTAPAINNGTLTGGYAQLNKLFLFRILLTVGSSTTFGTGVLSLSLPGTPRGAVGTWTWKGVGVDASVAQYEWNLQWSGAGTTCLMLYPNTGSNALVALSGTAPWTAGTADTYSVQGFFEGA
jgi:hypothetical protein